MFSPDVVALRQFYATQFGEAAHRLIAASLRALWPKAKGECVLGIGFATPYLDEYLGEAQMVAACMPAAQGAAYWPPSRDNLVLLAHESELPFPENSMNRVLLVHSIETSEQLSWMMEEIWRILTPGGRVLAIVPNRLGFWARSDRSPFGHGRPFSLAQMRDLMTEHSFTLTRSRSALFIPPTKSQLLWRIANTLEMLGHMLCPFIGGVWLVEAEKQVYASIKQPVHVRKTYGMPVAATGNAMSLER